MKQIKRWIDPYVIALLGTLVLGLTVPVAPALRESLDASVKFAVAALFLVYGMRLSTRDVIDGLKSIRLQTSILTVTYLAFPACGLLLYLVTEPLLGGAMASGILFLCLLPSTVQSSVVMTAIAKGNIVATICGATISNVLGILLTPLLVLWLMGSSHSDIGWGGIEGVLLNLLAPFIVGQLLQRWTGPWVRTQKWLTTGLDRGTILLVVFTAASAATALGVWKEVGVQAIFGVIGISAALLAFVLSLTWWGGSALGLDRPDRISLLMAGSTKSLATGLPMAVILLPPALVASVTIPVIVYHQLQLITCAVIARRLAGQDSDVSSVSVE